MGAWGEGPFENDAAADFVVRLDRSLLALLRKALRDQDQEIAFACVALLTLLAEQAWPGDSAAVRKLDPRVTALLQKDPRNWRDPEKRLDTVAAWLERWVRSAK